MSIAVAVQKGKKTVVAADTLSSFGDQRIAGENLVTSKVRRVGSALVATTGWAVYENILADFLEGKRAPALRDEASIFAFFMKLWKALHERYPFVNDQSEERDTPFGDLAASFLIANRSGIYKVSSDTSVCRFRQYYAIGCGADYALGALHVLYGERGSARDVARRAVEASIAFDVHCGGEIELFELG
jgi:ATP-dependent HslUV protease subunit HslV